MNRFTLSEAADLDLEELFEYGVVTHGALQAVRYHDDLLKTIETIAAFPEMARERTEFGSSARVHHHSRHYIIYIVRKDDVFVLRIIRDEADLARCLRTLA